MPYRERMVDRQVGRNAELFALAVGEGLKTPEQRYPYLRILISILEQARPEWHLSPNKDRQIAHAVFKLSRGQIPFDEVSDVVKLRDMERGYLPLPDGSDEEEETPGEGEAPSGPEGSQDAAGPRPDDEAGTVEPDGRAG